MKQPYTVTKAFLKGKDSSVGISTTSINPNPRLKKYYFWIYHYDMPYESAQEVFFKDEHKLSPKKAIDSIDELKKDNIPFAYVSTGYHRLGTKVFNYEKMKEKDPDIEFPCSHVVHGNAYFKVNTQKKFHFSIISYMHSHAKHGNETSYYYSKRYK